MDFIAIFLNKLAIQNDLKGVTNHENLPFKNKLVDGARNNLITNLTELDRNKDMS